MAFADLIERIDRAVLSHLGSVTVTYAPEVGDAVDVSGIFDANYRLSDEANAGVEQVMPAVWLRLEDLPVNPDDDEPTLTIAGNTYRVRERRTDGTDGGSVHLLLHRSGI